MMAYQKYTGLKNANEIMAKIAEYAANNGWTVLLNNVQDLAIDGSGENDGLRLSIKSPTHNVFAHFRSANGKKIFEDQANDQNAHGIGLTCSTAHTNTPASGFWFDQPNAPLNFSTQKVIGVGIPVKPNGDHTLYLNGLLDPVPMLLISVESDGLFQHMAVGSVEKVGAWDGGTIFSASRNSYKMFTNSSSFDAVDMELETDPIFAMCENANTFLRADIDAAPQRRPSILWASAGSTSASASSCYTGKQLGLPVKKRATLTQAWDPKIPTYAYLQSQTTTDSGRNVNTLNCITVDMPQMVYALRDPDGIRNFSPMGYVPGLYFISLKNIAPGCVYETTYPKSGNLHQVFPYTRRRGFYGFDGFSVEQKK